MDPDPMDWEEEEVRREMGVIMEWRREMCSPAIRDLNRIWRGRKREERGGGRRRGRSNL